MFVDMAPFSAPGQIQAFLIASPKISFVMDLMTALMVQMSVLAHLQMRDEVKIITEFLNSEKSLIVT